MTMSEVLAAHCGDYEHDDHGLYYECLCGQENWRCDGSGAQYEAHAAHVAEELTKAGYGKQEEQTG